MESIFRDSGSDSRRNLNIHAAFLQKHLVISRCCRLVFMAVMLTENSIFQLLWRHLIRNRHQTDIYQIGAAGSAQMCVREAVNHIFVVIIARTRVPSDHLLRFRAQLNHSLRHCGTWESASAQSSRLVGLRSDKWINKFSVIVGVLRNNQNRQKQSQNQSKIFFHSDKFSMHKNKEKIRTFAAKFKTKIYF